MKIYLLSCLLLILTANNLLAEKDEKKEEPVKKNNLSLQIGSKKVFLKDQLFAPLNFKNRMIDSRGISLRFRKQKRRSNIFSWKASFYQSQLSSDANDIFTTPIFQLNTHLSYHIRISKGTSNTRVYVGPRYDLDLNFIGHSINVGATAISLLTANSLSPSILLQKSIGTKNSIDIQLSAPLYGLVYRPPYSVFTDELEDASTAQLAFGGRFVGFQKYKTFKTNINLNIFLSKTFDLISSYEFIVQRSYLTKNYSLGSHGLNIGLNLKY